MQAINVQLSNLLKSLIEAPTVYAWIQLPAVNTNTSSGTPTTEYGYLGSQLVLQNITSLTLNRLLATGSNSMDFTIDNTQGVYSPLNNAQAYTRYFQTGLADLTCQLFIGVTNNGAETILPMGVYLGSSNSQNPLGQYGSNIMTVSGLDQFSLFNGDIYTSFPPRLYGSQVASWNGGSGKLPAFGDSYFNPNYLGINPSQDYSTWSFDGKNWMQDDTYSVLWAANFIQPNVYITFYEEGTNPVPLGTAFSVPGIGGATFTVNYNPVTGLVYTSNSGTAGSGPGGVGIPSTASNGFGGHTVQNVVSVDATPLSMSPEVALYHLFVDFGGWNPAFLKLDCTGIQIPVVEVGREVPIIQAATDIVNMVAPRGQRWRLWIDEIGYIRFTEGALDHVPVKYLTDTRDLLTCTFQVDTNNLYNVVRATGTSVNNQPLTAIAYDNFSINTYSQQPTYDVPSQYLNILMGMDPGAAMSYANGLVSSFLNQYSRPEVTGEIQIMPDTSLQTGDLINITETSSGVASNWVISQINDSIQESTSAENWNQTLYVTKMNYSQDYNYGIQANIGQSSPNDANTIQAESGFIQDVSFQTSLDSAPVLVVSAGSPVYDSSFNPLLYTWRQGIPLNISITVNPPFTGEYNGTLWMWRWMTIGADPYTNVYSNYPSSFTTVPVTGSGTMIGEFDYWTPITGNSTPWLDIRGEFSGQGMADTYPYDVRANTEPNTGLPTPTARRFWRPVLICPDWYALDGGGPTNAVAGYTYNSATINGHNAPSFTFNSTWTGGVGPYLNYDPLNAANNQPGFFYGMMRSAQNNYFNNTSSYFRGQELYGVDPITGQPTAGSTYLGTTSTVSFGVDYGYLPWENEGWTTGGGSVIIGQNNYVTDSEFNYTTGGSPQWTLTNFNVGNDNSPFNWNALVTAAGVSTQATAVGPQLPVGTAGSHNPLQAGANVTFSCRIQAQISSGTNIRAYIKDSSGATVTTLTQTAGNTGILSSSFTVASGITYYVIHFDTGTFTAGSGNQIKYSQAMLSISSVYPGVYTPSTVVSSNLFYGITTKVTPCFLNILTATNFGTMQLKQIQFNLEL